MIEVNKIELITDDLKEYIAINMEITKLNLVAKTAIVTASIFSGILVTSIAFLAIMFTSIGIALYLSGYNLEIYTGFGMIAGFYIVLFLLVLLFKDKLLINPFKDQIIRKLLSK